MRPLPVRMAFTQLRGALLKETRLLLRDREAMVVLLLMPAVFVLIMSLALQDSFQSRSAAPLTLRVVDNDHGPIAKKLISGLRQMAAFRVIPAASFGAGQSDPERRRIIRGQDPLELVIPAGTTAALEKDTAGILGERPASTVVLQLWADPALPLQIQHIAEASLNSALETAELRVLLSALDPGSAAGGHGALPLRLALHGGAPRDKAVPTSVQQTAPAWALLSMFFLVIPLSVTLVKERQQGCLQRLQTIPVPASLLFLGKILPYLAINQLQVALTLLESVFLLPRLGGQALQLGNAPGALIVVSLAANVAAIGYGLLVASFVKSQEQATSFGAISVLILGAIGGVMVPTAVMPESLQHLSHFSPLAWGLEGFQTLFVRDGQLRDVLKPVLELALFGAACMGVAVARFRYLNHRA